MRTVILDNGSRPSDRKKIHDLAQRFDCLIIDSPYNLGWGGAINHLLDRHWDHLEMAHCILLIMAHDCLLESFDPVEIASYFDDPSAIFVCPDYPIPLTSHYNLARSYYSKPGMAEGLIKIGHQTAFFTRPVLLKGIRYDEEFWLYGGEYEIFTRAHQAGLRTYQAVRTVVVNPSSDTSSESCLLGYKLNSLYCAFKRHGYSGLAIRSLVIFASLVAMFVRGDYRAAVYEFRCLAFAISNPGCGHQTYRRNPKLQAKYKITPLNH